MNVRSLLDIWGKGSELGVMANQGGRRVGWESGFKLQLFFTWSQVELACLVVGVSTGRVRAEPVTRPDHVG